MYIKLITMIKGRRAFPPGGCNCRRKCFDDLEDDDSALGKKPSIFDQGPLRGGKLFGKMRQLGILLFLTNRVAKRQITY